jgi:hypothetical protein
LMYEAILHGSPGSPARLNPDIPSRLEEIIEKALEKDCVLRYQSATELRTDLKRLKRDMESAEAGLAVQSAASRALVTWMRRRRAVIIAAIAICAFVTVFVLWRRSISGRPEARMLLQRSVTANPTENPVYASAISPNGRYLAYADLTGVFVRLLESGETHSLPLPEGFCFR